MLINFVDATNDANHYTKPPPAKVMGNDVVENSCAKFHYICSGFLLPHAYKVTQLVIFFEGRVRSLLWSQAPAPIFKINTSDVVSHKNVPLGIPKTKFYISTPYSPN